MKRKTQSVVVMGEKQPTLIHFETMPEVMDLLLGFCLRRPSDRLLDPGCGKGDFLQRADLWCNWLADSPQDVLPDRLWGVEMDADTAVSARNILPNAHILNQNFFTFKPNSQQPFDAIISNPPYAPAGWIGRLHRESGQQMAFAWEESDEPRLETERLETKRLIPRHLWRRLSHYSELHAYILLHSLEFLRERGRLGFIIPNGWLDAAYGVGLKQFLLDNFRIVALIESSAEYWLGQGKDACLLVLEKCEATSRRAANMVRLVRMKRPLSHFIPYAPDNPHRLLTVERLVPRLLPSNDHQSSDFDVRVLPQWQLEAANKWGLTLRAPDVYRKQKEQATVPQLKSWATVQRGYTTGANRFFYLDEAAIEQWGIEPEFRRPLLKTLRGQNRLRLDTSDCQTELLWLPPGSDWEGTAVADYIAWGEKEGFSQRTTCSSRHPWYSLPDLPPAQLILPASMWQRQFAPLLTQDFSTDQQLYRITLTDGVSPMVAAALFNSAWFGLQHELQGRVSFGKGLLRLTAYELENILLPDPRQFTAAQTAELERCFERLTQRPISNIEDELGQPDRQALDTAVFDILNFTVGERTAVYNALLDRLDTRLQK